MGAIARIARNLTIAANEQGYASAAVEIGASPLRVYLRHVLPNIASTLIVSVTLTFPEVILLESGLSFLGLGVQPPMTSLATWSVTAANTCRARHGSCLFPVP